MGTRSLRTFLSGHPSPAGVGLRLIVLVVLALGLDQAIGQERSTNQDPNKSRWSKPTPEVKSSFMPDVTASDGIGVDSQEGRFIDGNVNFYNSDNGLVLFGNFFESNQKPYILAFNFTDCPKLCSVQLTNLTMALRRMDLEVGEDFDFISISIDPKETPAIAKATKERYVGLYNRPESQRGWHFLTGSQEQIESIADQVGYRYRYIPEQKSFSHTPALILVSPSGQIVRYIPGLDYDTGTLRLALIEAAEGKIGSPVNWAMYSLGCFSYDGTTGQYTFQAMALMRVAGGVMVLIILIGLVPYWFSSRSAAQKLKKIDKLNAEMAS